MAVGKVIPLSMDFPNTRNFIVLVILKKSLLANIAKRPTQV
jgi:hypothetical protein